MRSTKGIEENLAFYSGSSGPTIFQQRKKQAKLMVAQMGQPSLSRFYTVHLRLRQWKYWQHVTARPEAHSQPVAAHIGRWHYLKLAPALLIRAVKLGNGFGIRNKMWHFNKGNRVEEKGQPPAGPK